MTKLHQLAELGQAIWLDYIRRSLITSGQLRKLVDDGLRGMTSNPTIFDAAISGSEDYDNQMRELVAAGKSSNEIFEALAIKDIQDAAAEFRRVYDQTDGLDGYVSLEVNPHLASDTQGTMEEARRLFQWVNRPNVFIKVPATPQGIPAIEPLISEGININITLMFSMQHYEAVANAYIAGLEKRAVAGGEIARVASVASFFVSRVDSKIDPKLDALGEKSLRGTIGIANSKLVYQRFKQLFSTSNPRWQALAEKGARVQRPLWASTSTKDPAYPDTMYVDALIGPHTVDTAPPDTLKAFLDHGTVALTLEQGLEEARSQLARLAAVGIDLRADADEIQREGVEKFSKPFDALMKTIEQKREQFEASLAK